MSSRGQHFAQVLLARYEELALATDDEISKAGGVSDSTMTKVRAAAGGRGDMAEPRNPAFKKYDKSAQWEPGSARKLWFYDIEPVPAPSQPDRPAAPIRTDPEFRAQVERAKLSEDQRRRILAVLDAEESAQRAELDDIQDHPLTS